MSKKPPQNSKEDKKPAAAKEDKPKLEELIFSNLSRPQLTFDRTGYTFTLLSLDVENPLNSFKNRLFLEKEPR